jgi:hypothetical protein
VRSRLFQFTGLAAALVALFVTLGGHWALLQSVAWARMLADFSRTETLGTAIGKTFDGEHPCPMCLQIREGKAQEQKQAPVVKWENLPEFAVNLQSVTAPCPPGFSFAATGFVPAWFSDFGSPPPKPPPRAA